MHSDSIKIKLVCEDLYKPIIRAVEKVSLGYSNLAFIKGTAGLGKSVAIKGSFQRFDTDYVEITGEVTEAYLYRLLFENNGKVIYFRDLSTLFKGLKSINLLKSANETDGVRWLTKSSYSIQQSDLPDGFSWKGRMIFDYNEIAQKKFRQDFEALTSRGDYIEFTLSKSDKHKIMRAISRGRWKRKVTNYLIFNYKDTDINLRHQTKAFNTYRYAISKRIDWRDEIHSELNSRSNPIRRTIFELIGKEPIRTKELKKRMLLAGFVNSLRTAHRKVSEWQEIGELVKVSAEDRNYNVRLR